MDGRILAPVRKCCEATLAAQTGWWVKVQQRILSCDGPTTPPRLADASQYFLMPLGPPLLARRGKARDLKLTHLLQVLLINNTSDVALPLLSRLCDRFANEADSNIADS